MFINMRQAGLRVDIEPDYHSNRHQHGLLNKNPAMDIDPGDARVPRGPKGSISRGPIGQGGPPGAGSRVSTGDVVATIGVKVAHLQVGPWDIPAPLSKQTVAKRVRAVGKGHPPLPGLGRAANDVGAAVAVQL